MNSRDYTTIVFDLGNVLIPFDHTLWVKNYNKVKEGLGDKYIKNYLDNYHIHRDYESGKMSDDDFIAQNLTWLENRISADEFCHYFSNIFVINQEVADLLPILKDNYKLVLLSNTNHIHKKYGWEKYSFLKYFDKLILSHEVGAVKPEEKIYKAVELFTKEKPETHIFIDDIVEYVNGAKKLGWDGIHFSEYKNLLLGLKIRNII
jgi:putative hydrolase of the HAD superfamily